MLVDFARKKGKLHFNVIKCNLNFYVLMNITTLNN